MKHLVVLLGPTGVGKTALSLELAQHLGSPIIGADSRQIFAELPIGTASPTVAQRALVPHYFVASHRISDYYSASLYESEALQLIHYLHHQATPTHDSLLMCGGSMMYIDAVCNGIDDIPTIRDDVRQLMLQRLQCEGLEALVEELRQLDPEHWAVVDRHNPRRVVHALEVCHQTGRTYTSFRTHVQRQRPFHILRVGLDRPREEMYQRINQRVIQMMDEGLEKEARSVYSYRHLNALNTVGYKEMFAYFDGKISRDEAVRQIQSNTRRYMRKQLTWFKRDKSIVWFHPENVEQIIKYVDETLHSVR